MILISNTKNAILVSVGFLLFGTLFACFSTANAQSENTQTLSVSPTLFQMTANPQQSWKSEIRIINVNDYDLTVYPQVVNFAPSGESGIGDFIPVFSAETKKQTLAEWIDLSPEAIVIPKQQTVTVPFTVTVPKEASPGGHYAAILIGTKPATNRNSESQVQTAQFVSSLFFVRISGDVKESGDIREFRTTKLLYQTPEVGFEVRFENTGNVHLQPQGDIAISNMWGEERGTIPINQQTHFGNVLPDSIRKFEFAWRGEESAFDIGRYKAVVTLGYGDEAKNFTTSTTYFWIVPYKQIAIIVGLLVAILWFFTFAVKLYIKRMLVLSGIEPKRVAPPFSHRVADGESKSSGRKLRFVKIVAPLRSGSADLWGRLTARSGAVAQIKAVGEFVYLYKVFFFSCAILVVVSVIVIVILARVNVPSRQYEVTIKNPDTELTISSESIYYENLKAQELAIPKTEVPQYAPYTVAITNVSGRVGVAAKLRITLEGLGYRVSSVSADLGRTDERSVIIYHPEDQEFALTLSKQLGGALLSANPQMEKTHITINAGRDQGQ